MIAIDGHVHIHDCFEIESFLKNAVKNLRSGAAKNGVTDLKNFALFLTETKSTNSFLKLNELAQSDTPTIGSEIMLKTNSEKNSLCAEFSTGENLSIIAGRQIVTQEDLEVLPIGIAEHFMEKEPINKVISATIEKGGIPLIPWGFGKWLGGRGKVIESLLAEFTPAQIYFGDNGNRFNISGEPKTLEQTQKAGFIQLSGSDPLPLPSESNKVGQLGFVLDGEIDQSKPFESITKSIQSLEKSPKTIGKLESFGTFFKNQLYMQYYKRIKK